MAYWSTMCCHGALHTFSWMTIGGRCFLTQPSMPKKVCDDSPLSGSVLRSVFRLEKSTHDVPAMRMSTSPGMGFCEP